MRNVAQRVRSAERSLALLHDNTAWRMRRAEEIRNRFLSYQGLAAGIRGRLRNAADSLPLSGWGKTVDPKNSTLLDAIEKLQDELRGRLSQAHTAFKAKWLIDWSPLLAPEDRVMVLSMQLRLSRLEERFRSLEAKSALLREIGRAHV